MHLNYTVYSSLVHIFISSNVNQMMYGCTSNQGDQGLRGIRGLHGPPGISGPSGPKVRINRIFYNLIDEVLFPAAFYLFL